VPSPNSCSIYKKLISLALIASFTLSLLAFSASPAYASITAPGVQWKNTVGPTSVNSIVQTSDGGYAMVGRFGGDLESGFRGGKYWVSDYYLMKVSGTGSIQWKESYPDILPGNGEGPFLVMQTKDQGYAILCHFSDSKTSYHYSPCILKTDSHGTMEWYKTYETNNEGGSFKGFLTRDNNFLLYGTFTGDYNNGYETISYLIKIDTQGNVLWTQNFSPKSSDVFPVVAGGKMAASQ
jgi:hypothetical protein